MRESIPMTQSTALLFPGQGTQKPGMGMPFVGRPEFSIATQAGEILGLDIAKLICDDQDNALSSTHDAQLAILVTSLMSYETLWATDISPICFAGHSLGQVTALICAGVLNMEEGLLFASKRAKATQKCAEKHPGAMAALLGADAKSAQIMCDNFVDLWIANDNAPGQIVVAGSPQSIDKACEISRDYEIKKAVKLPVDGAFHTPFMNEAVEELKPVLEDMTFNEPTCGVASNDDGRAYTTADVWKEKLSIHVARPVKWRDCMDGVALFEPSEVYEVGFGNTLAGLAKRCTPDLAVISWYDQMGEN